MKTKIAKNDFTKEMLPSNRKELFFDIFKLHYKTILLIGLILLISFLPLLIVLFLRDSQFLGMSIKVNGGELSNEDYQNYWKSTNFIYGLISIPCIFLVGFGVTLFLRIVRQLCWLEPIFYKEDIKQSLKDNYKSCFVISLLVSIILILTKASILFFNSSFSQYLILGMFLFFIVPPLLLTISMTSIYNGTFKQFFKNSLLIYIKNVPLMVLFSCFVLFPLIFALIDVNIILKYVLLITSIFFLTPIGIVGFSLYANSLFDKYINTTNYPNMVNKGLICENSK